MVLMGVKRVFTLRDDVFDESLDELLAPSLGAVVRGSAPRMYVDSREFFEITEVTSFMRGLLENVVDVLWRGVGKRVHILGDVLGGGKTHTLLFLYHSLRNPEFVETDLANRIRSLGDIRVGVVDCEDLRADEPLWVAVAESLGMPEDFIDRIRGSMPVSDIEEMFRRAQPFVLLIDEISSYIQSVDEGLLGRVIIFVKTLTETLAQMDVKGVIVLSLPLRGERGVVESGILYRRDKIEEIYNFVKRVAVLMPPLKSEELINIIRRRLFVEGSDVPRDKRSVVSRYVNDLFRVYESYPEVFPLAAKGSFNVLMRYYPFHPALIEYVCERLKRNPSFQQTRGILRLMRVVARAIWRSDFDPEVIMPWHVDLDDDHVLSILGWRDWREEIRNDLNRVLESMDSSDIRIARAVYYSAVLLSLPVPILERATLSPTRSELTYAVFERSLMSEGDLSRLEHVFDALEEKSFYIKFVDGRYVTFFELPSIKKIIIQQSQRYDEDEVSEGIVNRVKGIVRRYRKGSMIKGMDEYAPFDVMVSSLLRDDDIPVDDTDLKLVVVPRYVPYSERADKRGLEADEITEVFEYKDLKTRNPRVFKNSLVIVSPSSFGEVARNYRMLKACDELRKNDMWKSFIPLEGLRDEERRVIERVIREQIVSFSNRVESDFYRSLKDVFSVVWFYRNVGGMVRVLGESYKGLITEFGASEAGVKDFIVGTAVSSLKKAGKLLSAREMDPESFYGFYLSNILSTVNTFEEILKYFRRNPEFPMISLEDLKNILSRCVEESVIGFIRYDEVIWGRRPPTFENGYFVKFEDIVSQVRNKLRDNVYRLKDRATGRIYDPATVLRMNDEELKKILKECELIRVPEIDIIKDIIGRWGEIEFRVLLEEARKALGDKFDEGRVVDSVVSLVNSSSIGIVAEDGKVYWGEFSGRVKPSDRVFALEKMVPIIEDFLKDNSDMVLEDKETLVEYSYNEFAGLETGQKIGLLGKTRLAERRGREEEKVIDFDEVKSVEAEKIVVLEVDIDNIADVDPLWTMLVSKLGKNVRFRGSFQVDKEIELTREEFEKLFEGFERFGNVRIRVRLKHGG